MILLCLCSLGAMDSAVPAGQFACINMKFNTVHMVALLGS